MTLPNSNQQYRGWHLSRLLVTHDMKNQNWYSQQKCHESLYKAEIIQSISFFTNGNFCTSICHIIENESIKLSELNMLDADPSSCVLYLYEKLQSLIFVSECLQVLKDMFKFYAILPWHNYHITVSGQMHTNATQCLSAY